MRISIGAKRTAGALALAGVLGGCMGGSVSTGSPGTAVSGAAAGGTSVNANSALERCAEPFGTLAVDDGRQQSWWGDFYANTKVTTIEPLIRTMVQQSNCFVITSMGNQRLEGRMSQITDRQRNSGEFRAGSRQQAGQRVAADYFMEPAIVINNASVGGVGGAVGGALFGGVVGALGGALQSKSSVVTLSLFDIRSQVQIAAAEGSSTATNFGAALAAFGGGVGGGFGGLSTTPEGKATVAAFMDSYNQMVVALKNYRAQDVRGGMGRGGTLRVN